LFFFGNSLLIPATAALVCEHTLSRNGYMTLEHIARIGSEFSAC